MKYKIAALSLVGSMLFSCDNGAKSTVALETEKDTTSYAIGANIAKQLDGQGLDTMNVDAFAQALADYIKGNEMLLDDEQVQQTMMAFSEKMQENARKEMLAWQKDNAQFLEDNKEKEGVVVLESGLQYKVLKSGDGAKVPYDTSKVTVHYTGTLIDGTKFDSSVDRGAPASFGVNQVIRGWQEALQLMSVGDKWELYIPMQLGYGPRGSGQNVKPFSTLIFEVELLGLGDITQEMYK